MASSEAGGSIAERLDRLYEFDREPIAKEKLQRGRHFAGLFAGEHVAATEFVIGALRDITAHVRLQEEYQARARLEGVVEMAGAAAHELNNPLFAALGTAKLLMEDGDVSSPQMVDLKTVISNLERVSELTRKMSGITRYASKKYVGDVQIIDIEKASADPPKG